MTNSGYVMVDMAGLDLDSASAVVIEGCYPPMLSAIRHKKACCLYNVQIDSAPIAPIWALVMDNGDDTLTLQIESWSGTVEEDGTVTPE